MPALEPAFFKISTSLTSASLITAQTDAMLLPLIRKPLSTSSPLAPLQQPKESVFALSYQPIGILVHA